MTHFRAMKGRSESFAEIIGTEAQAHTEETMLRKGEGEGTQVILFHYLDIDVSESTLDFLIM